MKIDLTEIDTIFLTYDEPKKEEFWAKIRSMIPWAKRVDGVKGSDAAHKAAAMTSTTDWFVLIDGDNIPDKKFFSNVLDVSTYPPSAFRWKARNHINGLTYGNGGVSCWHKDFVLNMKTHENSDGRSESMVEFCFEPNYYAMHDVYSVTYPNQSPFQAWRAGFREGVKLALDRGKKVSPIEFLDKVYHRNIEHLRIWQSIGLDVENGIWAIYGSRLGTHLLMLSDWDYSEVQDFEKIKSIWERNQDKDPYAEATALGNILNKELNLEITIFDEKASKFFKEITNKNTNKGIMIHE